MQFDREQAAGLSRSGRRLSGKAEQRDFRWSLAFWFMLLAGSAWSQTTTGAGPSAVQIPIASQLAAAKQGDPVAQVQVGKVYYKKGNAPEAVRWFRLASEKGSAEGTAWLGGCYLLGQGVGKDEQQARTLLDSAVGAGNAVGLRFMGELHEKEQDYVKAMGFYSQAGGQGDSAALIRLARLYAQGIGVQADKKKASGLLAQAAAQGDDGAQLRLGRMYERGDAGSGIGKNPALAIQFYAQAATQANRLAAYRLGQSYSQGVGTVLAADQQKGFAYYKQSAQQGYAPAQYQVARIRELGDGVAVNLVAAYYWYSLAKRQGHALAAERLLALRSKMDSGQIKEAEDLLRKHDQAERQQSSAPSQ